MKQPRLEWIDILIIGLLIVLLGANIVRTVQGS
jgi:hypothetical protein